MDGADEGQQDEEEPHKAKGKEEVEVLVVGVHAAVGQGGVGGFHLLAALVGHIARAHPEEGMAQEDLPGVAPQLDALQGGEVADAAEAAEVLELVEEDVEHLAGAGVEVDGIGDAFLYGLDVGRLQVGHAEAVFGVAHGSKVAEQGGVDGVARGGDGVEGEGAHFAPLLAQFLLADVVVDVVAVFDKPVLPMEVGVAVGCEGLQRSGGKGSQVVVVVEIEACERSGGEQDKGQREGGGMA